MSFFFLLYLERVIACVCVCLLSFAGAGRMISHCSIYWQWLSLCNSECMLIDEIYTIYMIPIEINMILYVWRWKMSCHLVAAEMVILFGWGSPNSFLLITIHVFSCKQEGEKCSITGGESHSPAGPYQPAHLRMPVVHAAATGAVNTHTHTSCFRSISGLNCFKQVN